MFARGCEQLGNGELLHSENKVSFEFDRDNFGIDNNDNMNVLKFTDL